MIHTGQTFTATCRIELADADQLTTHGVFYKRPSDQSSTLLVGSSSGTDYLITVPSSETTIENAGTWYFQFHGVASTGTVYKSSIKTMQVVKSLI